MKRVSTMALRLKEYRNISGITLSDLSEKTGIPAQTLNRYELGQRAPKIDVAVQIAEALSLNPLWVQGYDVKMENEPTPVSESGPSDDVILYSAYKAAPGNVQEAIRNLLGLK